VEEERLETTHLRKLAKERNDYG